MSDKDCATKGDDVPSIVSQDDAGKIAVCYNKKTFYIGYPEWKGAPTHGGGLMDLKFTPLPGGTKDELSGSDKWKGLSLEDIVVRYVLQSRSRLIEEHALIIHFHA